MDVESVIPLAAQRAEGHSEQPAFPVVGFGEDGELSPRVVLAVVGPRGQQDENPEFRRGGVAQLGLQQRDDLR